jgi:hypothetical protein
MEWGKHNALTEWGWVKHNDHCFGSVRNSFVDSRAPMGQSDPTNGHP